MIAERRRLLLVEDHEVVAEGLRALLAPTYEILGPIRDGTEVLGVIRRDRPDAVLLDISLPGRNGIDLLPELHEEFPRLPVVVLTGSADFLVGRTAMVLGALGFLAKDCGIEEIDLALRSALAGRKYLSPRVPPPPRSVNVADLPPSVADLTPRQLQLLRLIGEGMETDAIAQTLGLSSHTIHFHRRNLRRVLGIDSESGLARVATMFKVREELQ
ncbi:MAG TPA: response regulator transcription factor [Anaeromyxobacteraceae bacterium]|nr:response regulator transcription factor [Anaeromyxobacteraceae bacterium]